MKAAAEERARRVVKRGVVAGLSGEKTISVHVERVVSHPLYKKLMRRRSKLLVHDEAGVARSGDEVEIMESRPFSRRVRWRLVRVVGHKGLKSVPEKEEEESKDNDSGAEPVERG